MERRPASSRAPRKGSNITLLVFILLTSAALVALSWFVWSINSVLNERTADLVESYERIATLESQLTSNTELFTESGESMTAQIEEWQSETRKVWANYQKHRDWIEQNEPIIAQMRQDVDSNDVRLDSLQESLTDIENSITQISRQQRNLTDDLNTELPKTNRLVEQLDIRVQRQEEAIEAIDEFRKQTNSSILENRRRISELETSN